MLLADPAITPAAKNARLIPAAQEKITAAREKLDAAASARDKIPAKLPANVIDPEAKAALLRTRRRGLQMVLRLLAHNAEHWLASHLNAYLRDDDEYRALTRQTIIRGLAGTITCTPGRITVTLQQPGTPRITRGLALLIDEINNNPPAMPGDQRPITYQLASRPELFKTRPTARSGDLGLTVTAWSMATWPGKVQRPPPACRLSGVTGTVPGHEDRLRAGCPPATRTPTPSAAPWPPRIAIRCSPTRPAAWVRVTRDKVTEGQAGKRAKTERRCPAPGIWRHPCAVSHLVPRA